LFFFVNILSGISLLAAGWLASRIVSSTDGLHASAFEHPASARSAHAHWRARRRCVPRPDEHLADGLPTRQSYTMAVVDPDERTATAGLTNVARNAATALSPTVTGWAFSVAALGLPFFIAGGIKILYDLLVFRLVPWAAPPRSPSRAAEPPGTPLP